MPSHPEALILICFLLYSPCVSTYRLGDSERLPVLSLSRFFINLTCIFLSSAQAAFLSALVGVEIAEAAARAAVKAISDLDDGASQQNVRSLDRNTRQQGISQYWLQLFVAVMSINRVNM